MASLTYTVSFGTTLYESCNADREYWRRKMKLKKKDTPHLKEAKSK